MGRCSVAGSPATMMSSTLVDPCAKKCAQVCGLIHDCVLVTLTFNYSRSPLVYGVLRCVTKSSTRHGPWARRGAWIRLLKKKFNMLLQQLRTTENEKEASAIMCQYVNS